MRRFIDRLYLFAALCANTSMFGSLFAGHASVRAGATSSPFSGDQSNPILFAINAAFGCATCLLVFPKIPQILFVLGRLKWLLALYCLVAFSVLWSESSVNTFRSFIYLSMYLVSAAYITLRIENHEEILGLIGNLVTFLAVLSIPGQFLLPHDSLDTSGWSGIFQQKNGLGSTMAVGIVTLVMVRKPWNLLRIGSLGLCSALLLLSHSTTSLFAAAAALGAGSYVQMSRRVRLPFLILFLGSGIALSIAISDFSNVFSEATGKDLTFTGRTEVWGVVLKQIEQRPVVGYGYAAFWSANADAMNEILHWHPGQSHNGYLEICLDVGIAGLLLMLFLLLDALRRARRVRYVYDEFTGVSMLAVTVLLVVHNFAEVDFLRMNIIWFVFLVAYLSTWKAEYACASKPHAEIVAFEEEQSVA